MPINMGGHIDVMFRSTEATRTTTPGSYVDGTMTDLLGRPVVSYSQLNDSSWITVHPNGQGTKGVPVRISENGTIEAGMGGKHNGKKLSELGNENLTVIQHHEKSQYHEKQISLKSQKISVLEKHKESLSQQARNEAGGYRVVSGAKYKPSDFSENKPDIERITRVNSQLKSDLDDVDKQISKLQSEISEHKQRSSEHIKAAESLKQSKNISKQKEVRQKLDQMKEQIKLYKSKGMTEKQLAPVYAAMRKVEALL
jgi:hypothetical protein